METARFSATTASAPAAITAPRTTPAGLTAPIPTWRFLKVESTPISARRIVDHFAGTSEGRVVADAHTRHLVARRAPRCLHGADARGAKKADHRRRWNAPGSPNPHRSEPHGS